MPSSSLTQSFRIAENLVATMLHGIRDMARLQGGPTIKKIEDIGLYPLTYEQPNNKVFLCNI